MLRPAKSRLGRTYGLQPHPVRQPFFTRLSNVVAGGTHLHAPPGFSCDYRNLMRPPRDQGEEGSCGAHAWAALKEHNCVLYEVSQGNPAVPLGGYLSVAHLYWNVRLAMGTFPDDSGTDNATAASVLQQVGVCPEDFLPYRCNPSQSGSAQCNVAGSPYRVGHPVVVPLDEEHLDAVLAAQRVVVLGFNVYESFEETGRDGMVPPLQRGEGLLGGHDVLVVGKRPDGLYIVRNSWGPGWGDGGHFYVPAAYIAATGMDGWSTV